MDGSQVAEAHADVESSLTEYVKGEKELDADALRRWVTNKHFSEIRATIAKHKKTLEDARQKIKKLEDMLAALNAEREGTGEKLGEGAELSGDHGLGGRLADYEDVAGDVGSVDVPLRDGGDDNGTTDEQHDDELA